MAGWSKGKAESMTVLEWLQNSFPEVSPKAFYRGIFPEGELEKQGEHIGNPRTNKYTGIIVEITGDRKPDGKRKIKRYTITDDLGAVDTALQSDNFCLCSPISYAGKQRTAENARVAYALAIDVDKIRMKPDVGTGEPEGLRDMYHQFTTAKYIPMPTYIVSSGTGVHLYYLFETPIPLFLTYAKELQKLKRELTRKVWNRYIVSIDSSKDIQQEGIYQGFRMPGTATKDGGRAKAFLTGERVTLEYLNSFVEEKHRAKEAEEYKRRGWIRLADAREKYGEWYERRIINKEPRKAIPFSRAIYDNWLERIRQEAAVGHRYYCLMTLAMYARKCSYYDEKRNPEPVTRGELEKDCLALFEHMESLTNDEGNHFSNDDILAALESFDDKWLNYPRSAIEYRTGITIPAQKRNHQKQAEHLEEARAIRDIRSRRRGEKWDTHNGRRNKAEIVQEWRRINPEGNKYQCEKETGISRKTIIKWWDLNPEDIEK